MHEIRLCKKEEYKLLQDFIKKEWKKDHIFVKSKQILDFQHFDKNNQRYNFFVAYNKNTKEFDAILGFILQSQYDLKTKDNNIWTSLWKAKKQYPSLGLKLLRYLEQYFNLKNTASAGMSSNSIRYCKLFNYDKLDKLYYFYIKNDYKKTYKLANFEILEKKYKESSFILKKLNITQIKNSKLKFEFFPNKSIDYFINRYMKHPIYKYQAYGVFDKEKIISIFFIRIIKQNNAKCMLIVDCLGKFAKNLYYQFQELLKKTNCEFISLLCYINNIKQITKMGFSLKNEKDLIPIYFEPFVKENIDIYFAIKSKKKNYAIFKGDSDQDRPNL
ncbi:hypothetical protein FPD46_04000 [Campylobacter peloridis]|uniref:GNAT family N-acetyltransferase n=1 Tax=Campylobacter peloridis TaxID=488546 RepID=A0A5C7E0L5_9BACT|nr:hypothetical protein [Campylobacter peloridis]TXE82853.1 hypothetical protein FPD46_04000 [Campylobacter peloridis]